jgi:biopolymer transport protein ExbD
MKIGKGGTGAEKFEMNMTPMIDVCFQLIIFFMLSLRLYSPEGDFNINMPMASQAAAVPSPDQVPVMKVQLRARGDGELVSIRFGDRSLGTDFAALRNAVRGMVGDKGGPGSAQNNEVELDCDYNLKYAYVMSAITAVSGYMSGGELVTLVGKIKFSPPRKP